MEVKAIVIRGEQRDLEEVMRIERSIGSQIYPIRGNKIRILGYGPILLASGEIVKVVVLENEGGKSSPGCGDGNLS